MRILSLFDGMACGMIAMQLAGVEVESYDSYEIDKYAVKTAQHNFPMIQEHGDVFTADFTQYEGVDFGIGGSPCTHWSIAQTKNRETTVNRDSKGNVLLHSSGIGVELFSQFLRMLSEAKPKFFIYENNKSMSKEIRAAITECFGFEPTEINSALVSAQNRQRLYWVGKRNADGTYSKVNVEQPEDRGILLKDVLDSAVAMREKAHAVIASAGRTTEREYFIKNQGNMAAEPVAFSMVGDLGNRKAGVSDKAYCLAANPSSDMSARVAEPINVTADGKAQCLRSTCYKDGIRNIVANDVDRKTGVAEPITDICQVGAMPMPNGELSTSAGFRVYSTEAKGRYLCANGGGAGAKTGLYAVPYAIEFDENGKPIKAIGKDGNQITVYEVSNGQITIKGKQYPIKLRDGFYIIRKLTVTECKRLQTVPEWYDFSCVSNSQAYKMLGNGWTCEVIKHLINSCLNEKETDFDEQCRWF